MIKFLLLILALYGCATGQPLPSSNQCYQIYKVGLVRTVVVDLKSDFVVWYNIPLKDNSVYWVTPVNEFALVARQVPCFNVN